MTQPVITPGRYRAVLTSALVVAGGYVAYGLFLGGEALGQALKSVRWEAFLAALALSLGNYGLRFLRWRGMLRRAGHALPDREHLAIYLAGFAFTTTPGKMGEMMRSVFLLRRGVPVSTSLAAFLTERVFDLLAIMLLALPGLLTLPAYRALGWVVAGGAALSGVAFVPALQRFLATWGAGGEGRMQRAARAAGTVLGQMQAMVPLAHWPGLVLLSTVAWALEGVGLWALIGGAGRVTDALLVYGVSVLAGALSFLPGGLGTAEAAMLTLLESKFGLTAALAAVVTLACRVATLWFAVLLGLMAVQWLRRYQKD